MQSDFRVGNPPGITTFVRVPMHLNPKNEEIFTGAGVKNLVRTYRLYQSMMEYPHLVGEVRQLLLSALDKEKAEELSRVLPEGHATLSEGRSAFPANAKEYAAALADFFFAQYFNAEQIENYINLARKKDAFHKLHQAVNAEGLSAYRIKHAVKEFCDIPESPLHISPDEAEGVRVALISRFISNQLPFIGIAKKYITVRDIDTLMDHSYWDRRRAGKIGGKAAGVFLASRILLPQWRHKDPELEKYVVFPDSYFFNSGILTDFLDYNNLHSFHSQKYKSREAIEREYGKVAEVLEEAAFPPDVMKDFRSFLEKIGEHPLIARSSSFLEDNLGHTFSGKYDSIFITNQGDLDSRLKDFVRAFKKVFMSTYGPAAILYRRDHNLLDYDERMSILVQRVVGRRFGRYFFPFAAGVAFSVNLHAWTPRIKAEDGLVRLVMGLGTRAVDRTGPDYPRMIPLSHPSLRPEIDSEKIRKYSQRIIDVLNLERRRIESVSFVDLFAETHHPDLYYAVSTEEEGHLAAPLFKSREINPQQSCVTFDNFLAKTPFVPLMKKVLRELERAYGCPVDVEFAWDDERLYILQCRSLAVGETFGKVTVPRNISRDQILFTKKEGVSSSIVKNIEYIVYIDPKAYSQLSTYDERIRVVQVVSGINRALAGKRFALFGPVRWGSNDVNLGVKVGYHDINHTLILGEIAFEEDGSIPEVSYGTHFFNDLIEARIVPLAIYPGQSDTIFREDFFTTTPNSLGSVVPDLEAFAGIARVIHVPSCTQGRLFHVYQDSQEQYGIGFFGFPEDVGPKENNG